MPQYVADYGVEEAEGLTVALQAVVVGAIIVPLREIRASEYFGKGKVAEIKAMVKADKVDFVVVNSAISPIQQRDVRTGRNAN